MVTLNDYKASRLEKLWHEDKTQQKHNKICIKRISPVLGHSYIAAQIHK